MPPVIASIAISIASSFGASVAFQAVLGNFILGSFGRIIGSIVLNVVSSSLFGKQRSATSTASAAGGFASEAIGRTQIIRSSVQPRRLAFGETMLSGPLAFAETTGTDSEFLHLLVPMVSGEVEEIGSVFFGEKEIKSSDLDGNGNVVSGDFSGKARIKKHLGTDAQIADSDLVSEAVNWTANHRLRGIAYVYARLEHDEDVFPTGIPNIKAQVKGLKVLDTRISTSIWTPNPPMCIRHYLTSPLGLNVPAAEIDDTTFEAAANICEEMVTLTDVADTFTADASTDGITRSNGDKKMATGERGQASTTGTLPAGIPLATNLFYIRISKTEGKLATSYDNALAGTAIDITDAGTGTHTFTMNAQARYDCNGTVDLDKKPIDVIEEMLTAMGGALVYTQGKYHLFVAAATTSSANIDTTWLRGPVVVRPKVPRRELFNAVRGTFVDPERFWQPTDFAPVENSSYETQDGGEQFIRDIELPYTTNDTRAQRIGKIHLEKSRQGITVELPCNFKALSVAVWDVVQITISKFGWVNKEFRVLEWKLADDLGINLTLQEEASASYNWNAGNETTFDAAPDTILPDPFTVAQPTSMALSTDSFLTDNGTEMPRIQVTWTAPADTFVKQGGSIEVQFKRSLEASYEPSFFVPGSETKAFIAPVEDDVNYDVRTRSRNSLRKKSGWVTITNFTVGAAGGGASSQRDYGFITDPATVFIDRGGIGEAVDKNLDYEGIA